MSGSVIVEHRIDKEGKVTSKIIKHEGGSTCFKEDDEALIQDLLETEVEGFGDISVTDSGPTPEHLEEQKKYQPKIETPLPEQKKKSGDTNPFVFF